MENDVGAWTTQTNNCELDRLTPGADSAIRDKVVGDRDN